MARRTFEMTDVVEVLQHWHASRNQTDDGESLGIAIFTTLDNVSGMSQPLRVKKTVGWVFVILGFVGLANPGLAVLNLASIGFGAYLLLADPGSNGEQAAPPHQQRTPSRGSQSTTASRTELGADEPPNHARAWAARGFNPDSAEAWRTSGFDARDAARWLRVVRDPRTARSWADLNFTSPEAAAWLQTGLTPVQATEWAGDAFDAREASRWRGQGFARHAEARRWRDGGVRDPTVAASWQRVDAPPRTAAEWLRAGFFPNDFKEWGASFNASEARRWCDAGYEVFAASMWKAAGATPQDAIRFGEREIALSEAKDWLAINVRADCAAELVSLGVKPASAAEWLAIPLLGGRGHIGPEAIGHWVRSGYEPSTAAPLLMKGYRIEDGTLAPPKPNDKFERPIDLPRMWDH